MKLQTFLKLKKCGEAPVKESLRHIFIFKVLSGQEVKKAITGNFGGCGCLLFLCND